MIDTGSDLSFVRRDKYFEIGAPVFDETDITEFKGLGTNKMKTLGKISVGVVIDDIEY